MDSSHRNCADDFQPHCLSEVNSPQNFKLTHFRLVLLFVATGFPP